MGTKQADLALYVCAIETTNPEYSTKFKVRKKAEEILKPYLMDKMDLCSESSGSRVCYFKPGLKNISELTEIRDHAISLLKSELPEDVSVKCFITLDWGICIVFPLDDDTAGADYLNRRDYSDYLESTFPATDTGWVDFDKFKPMVKLTKEIKKES